MNGTRGNWALSIPEGILHAVLSAMEHRGYKPQNTITAADTSETIMATLAYSVLVHRDELAFSERALAAAEERARILGGDLAFWHEEAHASRAWLGRLVERGCVPDEWQRYVAQFADATPAQTNPWRAELDARIERYVSAFARSPADLTGDEFYEWQRERIRLEQDAKDALTDYAMREAKNRNGIVSETPNTPAPRRTAEREAERAAEAWADDVALFILHKVTGATSLTLAEIAPNLTAPNGWLSFARLWRADYISVTGDLVQPTERGMAAMRELLVCVADVALDGTDGATKEATP